MTQSDELVALLRGQFGYLDRTVRRSLPFMGFMPTFTDETIDNAARVVATVLRVAVAEAVREEDEEDDEVA